jgi:vacuolar-type H+-ATPase subunit E/Vma4
MKGERIPEVVVMDGGSTLARAFRSVEQMARRRALESVGVELRLAIAQARVEFMDDEYIRALNDAIGIVAKVLGDGEVTE